MPSFDIVSEVDWQEVKNAVNQANREISTRFDFKGSDARVDESDPLLTVRADDDYKVGQVVDILQLKLAKRAVDVNCLQKGEVKVSPTGKAVQEITVRQGVDTELAKSIVKRIKAEKFKVQVAIQGKQVRVNGKKRDDLQRVIAFIDEQKLGLPLQYVNFRD
ncbi:MAG: YajQ family cyclic di-GMP-binding protein [Gammaproteobacteria bacterium]|nr:YajQ family cyclic di-GMP-binding protein [Gammaproteobacteria bacterium]MDD9885261.1 YajQ family cyclic di-GMP-binding protein [Gammaproteobacteria bacterium]